VSEQQLGVMDNGITLFTPGVNCIHCGRFIGRDGALYYEYFEMSSELASLDGYCGRCIRDGKQIQ
jgi:hypothetical protein